MNLQNSNTKDLFCVEGVLLKWGLIADVCHSCCSARIYFIKKVIFLGVFQGTDSVKVRIDKAANISAFDSLRLSVKATD